MTPDSTTQATLEDIRNHRKKIADNPWPFPAEKMNYVIPMVEMSSILSLVEAQAKELTQMRERIFELATPRALDGTTIQQQRTVINALEITNQAQAKRIEELEGAIKEARSILGCQTSNMPDSVLIRNANNVLSSLS